MERLKVAWIHQPGDITGGLQATPIVIDGVLYYISANNKVQALDAASGKELWRYETKLDPVASEVFFSVSSRGVTVAGGKVFLGTLDGRVIARQGALGYSTPRHEKEEGCQLHVAADIGRDGSGGRAHRW